MTTNQTLEMIVGSQKQEIADLRSIVIDQKDRLEKHHAMYKKVSITVAVIVSLFSIVAFVAPLFVDKKTVDRAIRSTCCTHIKDCRYIIRRDNDRKKLLLTRAVHIREIDRLKRRVRANNRRIAAMLVRMRYRVPPASKAVHK